MSIERLKRPSAATDAASEAKTLHDQAIAMTQSAEQHTQVLGTELVAGWRALSLLPTANPARADLYKREADKLESILRTLGQMREANP